MKAVMQTFYIVSSLLPQQEGVHTAQLRTSTTYNIIRKHNMYNPLQNIIMFLC
jgi:hypothetical protein